MCIHNVCNGGELWTLTIIKQRRTICITEQQQDILEVLECCLINWNLHTSAMAPRDCVVCGGVRHVIKELSRSRNEPQ